MDSHKSQPSLKSSEFAKEKKNIRLLCILPNATQVSQPFDLSIFRPLKNNWKRHVNLWTNGHVDEQGKELKLSIVVRRKGSIRYLFVNIFHRSLGRQ